MNSIKQTLRWILLTACGCFLACDAAIKQQQAYQYLIACGDEQVFIIDPDKSSGDTVTYHWQWHVAETEGLPESYRSLFKTIDECKPVGNGDTLLITASSGGVLLLDRHHKKALFYARVPNAHSAAMLPNNRVAVALSTATSGNSVEVYDIDKPDQRLFRDSLHSGHGVVWVPHRELLYALGFDQLRAYSLVDWETDTPQLHLEQEWKLPDEGGHDLIAVAPDRLLVSTTNGVWSFDAAQGQFSSFQPLGDTAHVKSVYYDPETDHVVYTKAEESWWTRNIYLENPKKTITLPEGFRLYKVRVL